LARVGVQRGMDHGRCDLPHDAAECHEGIEVLHRRIAELTAQLARLQGGAEESSASPASGETASLPQEVPACHALIAELAASVGELNNDKLQLAQENEELKLTITRLLLQLRGHRRERFVDDPNQMKLDLGNDPESQEALAEAVAEAEKIVQEYTVRRTLKPKRPRNEKLPDHIPRYEVPLPVPEEVANCPEHGPRKQIGEDRSELRIQRGACWSHARRKVFDGRGSNPVEASFVLAMIGELYDIEERGKTLTAEQRLELRQRESRPVLERLRAWLDSEAAARVLPKSLFAEALRYLRNHWPALNLYLSDGRCPIDNNDTEQLMKQVALGRKNWLFLGSVAAGYRAATFLTIVSTAHRNDLDVWAYVKDVLDQLLAGSTDYHALQADIWKQSHPEHIRAYRAEERRERSDAKRARRARRRLLARSRSP